MPNVCISLTAPYNMDQTFFSLSLIRFVADQTLCQFLLELGLILLKYTFMEVLQPGIEAVRIVPTLVRVGYLDQLY
jgi:hypothetical protein